MLANLIQPGEISNAVWYLGIDFDTTGLSAVLLNRTTTQRYPLFWSNQLRINPEELQTVNPRLAVRSSAEAIFRLPAVTYSGQAANKLFVKMPVTPIIVGSLASSLANNQPGIFLENFKPYLNIGIPYYCAEHQEWEPQLQLPNQHVSLYWVRRTLQALLATLTPKSTLADSVMKVGAVGMAPETLGLAFKQLEGVILGYPAAWSDTYQLNLREAVLGAKLVQHPEQIFFLEDAIATLLTVLPTSPVEIPENDAQATEKFIPTPLSDWHGGTLGINGGATTTELALVEFPDDLKNLSHSDFRLWSLAYGSDAIAQDIFCQLLYPQMSETQLQQLSLHSNLELPLVGQPEQQKRDRLALLLQSSALGKALIKAAGYLNQILQHKEEFTLELGTDRWQVYRVDMETRVIEPFIQQLHQGLKTLMIETGLSEAKIQHVVCVGDAISGRLEKWIRDKLPDASIVQASNLSTNFWVAAGLANLPLYPQVLNRTQQQYSDYFLLSELLRAFPHTAGDAESRLYSLEEIMQQLERRGLNTAACYKRLVRLVEGELPSGLVPPLEADSRLAQSQENTHYFHLTSEPLFAQEGDPKESRQGYRYRLNPQQQERLRQYLEIVLSGTYQKFEEPLIVKWGLKGD